MRLRFLASCLGGPYDGMQLSADGQLPGSITVDDGLLRYCKDMTFRPSNNTKGMYVQGDDYVQVEDEWFLLHDVAQADKEDQEELLKEAHSAYTEEGVQIVLVQSQYQWIIKEGKQCPTG